MRIGFFTGSYPGVNGFGGIGTYTRTMARALAARGHQVHVLTAGDGQQEVLDGQVVVHTVRIAHFPALDRALPGLGACFRVGAAMRRLAARERLHVVEFPNWEGLGLFYIARPVTPVCVRLSTSAAETVSIDGIPWTRALRWDVRRERWSARLAG
ncbi:MAG: glycosyltransferase family 1 protein, partial [Actinobacteria bacterium]